MPLYEYKCADCAKPFEMLVSSPALADSVVCRYCGSDSVRRLVSSFAAHATGGNAAIMENLSSRPAGGGGCACGGGGCGCR